MINSLLLNEIVNVAPLVGGGQISHNMILSHYSTTTQF